MLKILVIGLLQMVLAGNLPDEKPDIKINTYSGQQFFYRDLENRNLRIPRQDIKLNAEIFNNAKPLKEQNENVYLSDKKPLIVERSDINYHDYAISEGPESEYHVRVKNGGVNNFRLRNHLVAVHQKNGKYRASDLGSSFYRQPFNYEFNGKEYKASNNGRKTIQNYVRTKKSVNSGVTDKYFKSFKVPTERSNDNSREVKYDRNVSVGKIDNSKPDTSDKTKVDIEGRFNKNGGGERNEKDKWVWDGAISISPTTTSVENGFLVDNRMALVGGCLYNQARVRGMCVSRF